jgi:hypothetical protein
MNICIYCALRGCARETIYTPYRVFARMTASIGTGKLGRPHLCEPHTLFGGGHLVRLRRRQRLRDLRCRVGGAAAGSTDQSALIKDALDG